uniref:Transmembrane protein 267 n=1 Tax=Bombyx mori TaxID=7091 RepID=A0A8R2AK60_BOMMO|nr:transmembrane protein 267 [Bombyx mori]
MRFKFFLFNFLLVNTTIIGDYVVFNSKYSDSQLFRAIADSIVHASIGFLSSLIYFTYNHNTSVPIHINVFICTFVSSFIDVDHFIAAKSIYLKDALNLNRRGTLHCTTLWILITLPMLLYSIIMRHLNIYTTTLMLILAYSSHHIRDGSRRGLWMYPLGHTEPLNKTVYLFLTITIPNLLGYVTNCYSINLMRNSGGVIHL